MWSTVAIISIFTLCQGMIKDISFELIENCPIGTIVGNIKIAAELYLFKYVELSLENGDNFEDFGRDYVATRNLFKIDNRTSDLVSIKSIDREAICSKSQLKTNGNCSVIQIVSVNKLMWINVHIRIMDINDNHPTFRRPNVTLALSEISKVHSTVQLDEPVDLDSDLYGPIAYSLREESPQHQDQFQIQRNPLKLVLLKPLDYESIQQFTLIIIACDAGIPALCGNQTLFLHVINENDESPVFHRSNYTAIINEDASIGQVVLQTKAYDRDAGEYGKVKYSISSGFELAKIFFGINEDNGNVFIKDKFRNPTKFKFSIEAKDEAPNPLIGRTWLYLHIVDVNNNIPIIQISAIDSIVLKKSKNHITLEVAENNKIPLNLAFITVTDADQGENARCMCQFQFPVEQIELISVNEIGERNIYRLVSNKIFDAETTMKIHLGVLCNDHGQPQNTAIYSIELHTKDENEYPPTFEQSHYEIEVKENATVGTVVKHIKIYDRDVRQTFSLDIKQPGSSYFEINNSGTVTTKSLFDFEKMTTLEFFIFANDRGIKSFTSSTRVTVLVLDINDNTPEFEPNSNHFEVFENMKESHRIGQIKAFDKDKSYNSKLRFYLLNTSTESHRTVQPFVTIFHVNESTGVIHSNVSLDYENCTMYELHVKVSDCGDPPLSNSQKVYIHVKDRNDNIPVWQYPNKGDNLLNISYSHIRDSVLTRVRAVDIDGEQYNIVHYHLLSHSDIFRIEKLTGVLSLRSNRPPTGVMSILIQAVDANSADKQSSQRLVIQIHNDQPPFQYVTPFNLTFPVLISIIGFSSLISIVLVVILFFLCCRKRRLCKKCFNNSNESAQSKYDNSDSVKLSNHQLKTFTFPLDLVTEKDLCGNSIVEDSVKLIFGSLCPQSISFHDKDVQDYDQGVNIYF